MNVAEVIGAIIAVAETCYRFEAERLKIKGKTEKLLKGGKKMKFGTVIGIVIGALTLIAAGAAAAYFLAKKKGCCCEDDCCCEDECFCDCCDCEEVVDEYPAEEAPEIVVEGAEAEGEVF